MKKQIPAYIPAHDADVLAAVRSRAYHLDMSLFNFLGVRFGWSSVVGLVPELGDVIDASMAMMVVRKCNKVEGGLPKAVLMQMLVWVFIDFVIGLVPIVGDMLDAAIKANTKNCRILEEHLDRKYKPKAVTDRERQTKEEAKRNNRPYEPPAPATVYEDFSDENLPQYSTSPPSRHNTAGAPAAVGPARPEPARVPEERRGGAKEEGRGSKGWFSGGRAGSRRHPDVEMGEARASNPRH